MTPTFVLAVLIKGLLVLSIALGLSLLFRKASAAVRHGVWVAAFVALLALPLLEAVGPKWSVPIGPAPSAVESMLAPRVPAPPVPPVPPVPPLPPDASVLALERHAAQMERQAERLERQAERLAERAARDMEMEVHRLERQLEQVGVAHRQVHVYSGGRDARIVLASSPASVVQTIRSVPREIVLAMLWFWGLGALAVGLAWAVAYSAAARAVRLGSPETDEEVLATWERVRLLSGVSRPVRLLRSPALDVPIAWGWGDAAVVLPLSTEGWDDDRMEAVLLHELAHVIRGDAFSQLVAQVALVLHWANPLAWLAYRNFLLEREHACDDVVLEHGARPSAYADHLVKVARDLRRRSAALAAVAPMARRSNLEGRVLSILDPARKRAALSRAAGATLMLLLCGIALPLAALQPVPATAQETPEVVEAILETVPTAPVMETVWTEPADPGEDEETLDIQEIPALPEVHELATASSVPAPPTLQLALDTIPRFEDVIRPALEAALEAVRSMRTSERHTQLTLSDEDWDEMEEGIREAIDEARETYDEAIEDAIEEALEDMEDGDWDVSWSDQPDGARVGGYTTEQALTRARRDVQRAQHDAQRALANVHRNLERQIEREHRAAERRQRAAERNVRDPRRSQSRARATVQGSSPRSYSYSYSMSNGSGSVSNGSGGPVASSPSSGIAGWLSGLDGLDDGLDRIERSLYEIERADGAAHPSALAGLSAGLVGIQTGLSGIAGASQHANVSRTDKRIVKERVRSTRDRLKALQARVEDCDD